MRLNGDMKILIRLDGQMTNRINLDGQFGTFAKTYDVDPYTGEYVVVPKAYEEQTLLTRQKFMTDNVTVREIPVFEVSNEWGKTCYIADTVGGIDG